MAIRNSEFIAQRQSDLFLDLLAGRKSLMFGIRAAPEFFKKVGEGFSGPRGRPDPQNRRLPTGREIQENRKSVLSHGKCFIMSTLIWLVDSGPRTGGCPGEVPEPYKSMCFYSLPNFSRIGAADPTESVRQLLGRP